MTALRQRELYVAGVRLAAALAAAGESRVFIRRTLRKWQLLTLVEDAELVVSELVANAVKATGATGAAASSSSETGDAQIVGVQLR